MLKGVFTFFILDILEAFSEINLERASADS
jgi:hypothetical protein